MAAFVYTHATYLIATAALNLSTADLRTMLLMSDTTAGNAAGRDATTCAGITTLDEYDGTGYTRLDLAGLTATKVAASDRTEVTATNGTFGATVGPGTRTVKALLYVVWAGSVGASIPVAYDDTPPQFAAGTFNGDGSPMSISFATTGFLQLEA